MFVESFIFSTVPMSDVIGGMSKVSWGLPEKELRDMLLRLSLLLKIFTSRRSIASLSLPALDEDTELGSAKCSWIEISLAE